MVVAKKQGEKNYQKTKVITLFLSVLTVVLVVFIQIEGQKGLVPNASYLDPIVIDVLAFAAGFFLVIEGAVRIAEHKYALLSGQFTRILRILFGLGIITVHIIQVLHKF